ncbi:MAG: CoA transferase [Phenylobacterium sp.]|uniref:CaiB/BaiF CoA transferase family protein n=1 Tax=Phenylobacterium sp. TaxID=1871053 RepID=UPI00120D62DD|nr:CaiB/BaiF CoA-transferase family protein [Phenylobacterium sp.]TAJ71901.1 MAG: CoA transferase [Phenylobacterium sp.]
MLLEGLKVVEMATWVAGPSAAAVLADWGAEVVKVESPIGDATRVYYPDTPENPGNPIFTNENRGKKGVLLDISRPEGRHALKALLRQADIFITNVRPGSMKRLGLDYESLKPEMPNLIYGAVTGYGLVGPEADTPAFDMTAFWTRSGVAHATIPPDQEPFASRPGFGDHVTALATVSAILAALHERHSTGRGRLVETSLLRAGAYAISWDLAIQLRFGEVVTAQPRDERPGPMSGFFRTKDDRWLLLLPRTLDCFTNLMIALDRPEILAEPRYDPPVTDMDTVREIRAVVDEAFARMTLAEVGERLTAGDLAWAPMGTLAELAEADFARDAGCFEVVDDGWGVPCRVPASPARFPEGAPPVSRPAPKLGEHTREVLEAAGLTAAEIDAVL